MFASYKSSDWQSANKDSPNPLIKNVLVVTLLVVTSLAGSFPTLIPSADSSPTVNPVSGYLRVIAPLKDTLSFLTFIHDNLQAKILVRCSFPCCNASK